MYNCTCTLYMYIVKKMWGYRSINYDFSLIQIKFSFLQILKVALKSGKSPSYTTFTVQYRVFGQISLKMKRRKLLLLLSLN